MSSLPSPRNKECGFISLPPSIRRLIYSHVGAPKNHFIYLDREYGRQSQPTRQEAVLDIFNLLLVCQVIYTEVSSLLYSTNTVITHQLDPLLKLNKSALSSITSLKVHLNASAPVNVHDCSRRYACYETGSLNDHDPIIDKWKSVVNHIAPHIEPNKLELWFICDCEPGRADLAELVLAPLRQLPLLRRCHIRLGCETSHHLRRLAQHAAEQAMGLLPGNSTLSRPVFEFLRLPSELRLKILEYTDLVTPLNEVVWRPNGGFFVTRRCGSCKFGPPYCHPNDHEACALRKVTDNCKICPHTRRGWPYTPGTPPASACSSCDHYACQFYHCEKRNAESDQIQTGCFCASRHAAYSPLCRCWVPPNALFLVNRSFLQDARAIFFTHNSFTVHTSWDGDSWDPVQQVSPRPQGYPGSRFLNTLSTEALRDIHTIRIKCSPVLEARGPSTLLHIPDSIKDNLSLQHLYISIHHKHTRVSGMMAKPAALKDIDLVREQINKNIWPAGHADLISRARRFVARIDDAHTCFMYYLRPVSEELPRIVRSQLAGAGLQASRIISKSGHNEVESQDDPIMHEDRLVEGFWYLEWMKPEGA
ncbi:hypothetical protein F5Y13DRAFT_168643 [Hypoxylon sp. FL1857]|nr:hypothetical protein F5Y13DRAFT_168643 [Hypoxylon sp. FL1857]